jgi:hypothetical protein
MSQLAAAHGCDWEWIFSEAGHGKGAPDGIGAAIKRQADVFVAHGGNVCSTAELIGILSDSKIHILREVNSAVIDTYQELLNSADPIPPLVAISKSHHVYTSGGNIFSRKLACHCKLPLACDCFSPNRWQLTDVVHNLLFPCKSSIGQHSKNKPPSPTVELEEDDCDSQSETSGIVLPHFPRPDVSIGAYVVLRLQPDGPRKSPVFFVGLVICRDEETPDMWKIQCMRRQKQSFACFVFRPCVDMESYHDSVIVKILDTPKVVRSVYHFNNDLTGYGSGLR